MVIAGRSLSRATAFCAAFRGAAQVSPLQLDRSDIAYGLARETPDLVVDASGPFQDYGDDAYGVIRACIAARTDYVDFADGAGLSRRRGQGG